MTTAGADALTGRLGGRVAIVTGGSKGIGLAIAVRLAAAGADVMVTSRNADALRNAAAEVHRRVGREIAWHTANAGESDAAQNCVAVCLERFGRLDVLINNAATNPYFGPLSDIDVPRAIKTVQVNQLGPVLWTQHVWRAWMSEHGGCIVNVASVGGHTVEPSIGWYNSTKAALEHITAQLAFELGPSVRVNAVAPGLVKTEMARALWEPVEQSFAAALPLRRLGQPDDIAAAVEFLVSDEASWITGHVLVVDGGATCRPPVEI